MAALSISFDLVGFGYEFGRVLGRFGMGLGIFGGGIWKAFGNVFKIFLGVIEPVNIYTKNRTNPNNFIFFLIFWSGDGISVYAHAERYRGQKCIF